MWEAICFRLLSLIATFSWNFLDVFIMVIGIGLSTQFRLFNVELGRTVGQQLFSSFRPHPTSYLMIYFWYSLIFLLMRAFLVAFTAAAVNDESTKSIRILRSVSSYSWNTETKRFFDEVKCGTVALSGMKFFYLTRKIILSVASAIVTYELILMQFQLSYDEISICKS
ncbi:gustatory receptor for sugar taste 64f-like [Sitodiplosis mosellana]|uniref:gustatory receptor for sugar taste 64f-like n=1 Tax=Sitodiplosis mosellana TaxID=263140 RepID=UPI002444B273|nr:gustatory receptor for sugar taste 64f-like [Sitodiplosis mosellana]